MFRYENFNYLFFLDFISIYICVLDLLENIYLFFAYIYICIQFNFFFFFFLKNGNKNNFKKKKIIYFKLKNIIIK
jgi:hypothetical protein